MGGYEVQSGDEKQQSGYPGKPRRWFQSSGPRRRAARVKLVAISVLFWKVDRKRGAVNSNRRRSEDVDVVAAVDTKIDGGQGACNLAVK
jgi:hypothetical protein